MKKTGKILHIILALFTGLVFNIPEVSAQEIGDTVLMGKYPYEEDGTKKPIEWIIIDKEADGTVLLLTKYLIEIKKYNEEQRPITWAGCSLRNWLNRDFYNTAFNSYEKADIRLTNLVNHDNTQSGARGGIKTDDRVFLLSIREAARYFKSDKARQAHTTPYTDSRCNCKGTSFWWLRSPGFWTDCAAGVHKNGKIAELGQGVTWAEWAVRPALKAVLRNYVNVNRYGSTAVWESEKKDKKKESRKADTEMEKPRLKSPEEFLFH